MIDLKLITFLLLDNMFIFFSYLRCSSGLCCGTSSKRQYITLKFPYQKIIMIRPTNIVRKTNSCYGYQTLLEATPLKVIFLRLFYANYML